MLRTFGFGAFWDDRQLKDIKLSKSITELSSYLFGNCIKLQNFEIPVNVTKISDCSFGGCIEINSIKISKNLQEININAFYNCTKLNNIEIDKENKNFNFENGILFNKEKTQMIIILPNAIKVDTLVVPNTVTTLKVSNLTSYSQLTKLELPESITYIDPSMFQTLKINKITIDSNNSTYMATDEAIYSKDKTQMVFYFIQKANVEIEERVKSINSYCFFKNKALTKIKLPSSLTQIGGLAFWGCNNLQQLDLGEKIIFLDPIFIYGLDDIKVTIDSNNVKYMIKDNVIYSKDGKTLITIIGNPTEFVIPKGVTKIGDRAFHNKYNLQKITIPEGVTEIGASFNYCTALKEIEIPSSVNKISNECFEYSQNIKKIVINNKKGAIAGAPWSCSYGEKAIIYKK